MIKVLVLPYLDKEGLVKLFGVELKDIGSWYSFYVVKSIHDLIEFYSMPNPTNADVLEQLLLKFHQYIGPNEPVEIVWMAETGAHSTIINEVTE